MKKIFLLLDGRAKGMDLEDAVMECAVFYTADSVKEAKEVGTDYGEGLWVEFDTKKDELINPKARWDIKTVMY